jgi:ABC-type Co2+ transport system permease subunit
MHIEPGMVEASKIGLSYVTAGGAFALIGKLSLDHLKENGMLSLIIKAVLSTIAVFVFFQVFPHAPVGVSEVHLIMGSTIFLLFGLAPAAIGLALGLLIQGVFFAQFDLPQYGMNVTTLIIPMIAMAVLARKIITPNTAYKDLTYTQTLKLSTTYQAGIVAWVAFWAFYGQGFGAEALASVGAFGAAYMSVILIEPVLDLAVLALAKSISSFSNTTIFEKRLYSTIKN